LDENLSYRVADSLKAMVSGRSGLIVDCVRDYHAPGASDPSWIRQFAADDGMLMLSGDADILQHWPNLIAYIESGLIAFFPPAGFGNLKGFGQASLILRWWPVMIEKAKQCERGTCWRFPLNWNAHVATLKQLQDPRFREAEAQRAAGINPIATLRQFRAGDGRG